MSLIDRLKGLMGRGGAVATEPEGSDVRVHVEHPGMDAETAAAASDLEDIKGIGPTYAERLRSVDVEDIDDLAAADAATLADRTDISETLLATWIDRAQAHLEGA